MKNSTPQHQWKCNTKEMQYKYLEKKKKVHTFLKTHPFLVTVRFPLWPARKPNGQKINYSPLMDSLVVLVWLLSCPALCNCMDCSLPGSAMHGIFQARILEWVTVSFSRGSSQPRDWTHIFCLAHGLLFNTELPGKPHEFPWLCGYILSFPKDF